MQTALNSCLYHYLSDTINRIQAQLQHIHHSMKTDLQSCLYHHLSFYPLSDHSQSYPAGPPGTQPSCSTFTVACRLPCTLSVPPSVCTTICQTTINRILQAQLQHIHRCMKTALHSAATLCMRHFMTLIAYIYAYIYMYLCVYLSIYIVYMFTVSHIPYPAGSAVACSSSAAALGLLQAP